MISYSICVVDGEELVRDGIALAFKRHNQVGTFHSAEASMEAIECAPPDLVLLDIGLPP